MSVAKFDQKRKTLTIRLQMEKARPSKSSGKTLVIASTHGCHASEAFYNGQQIIVTANAFVYPAKARTVAKKGRSSRKHEPRTVPQKLAGSGKD